MKGSVGIHDHKEEVDLPRCYQNAIDCIVQCESLIITLWIWLTSKDKEILLLEEKVIRMSLDLISLKVFEDKSADQGGGFQIT